MLDSLSFIQSRTFLCFTGKDSYAWTQTKWARSPEYTLYLMGSTIRASSHYLRWLPPCVWYSHTNARRQSLPVGPLVWKGIFIIPSPFRINRKLHRSPVKQLQAKFVFFLGGGEGVCKNHTFGIKWSFVCTFGLRVEVWSANSCLFREGRGGGGGGGWRVSNETNFVRFALGFCELLQWPFTRINSTLLYSRKFSSGI